MSKYWGKQIFTHGRFPAVGQKQKMVRERKKERKRERPKCGNNNDQLHIANADWAKINPNMAVVGSRTIMLTVIAQGWVYQTLSRQLHTNH